jgi:DNA-binding transcriptional MerR regulator
MILFIAYFYLMPNQLSLFDTPPAEPSPIDSLDVKKLKKVYYTISEVSAMFRVNSSLLRFWEKEFPVQLGKVKKNKKGDRYYNKEDIEKLKTIFFLVKDKRMTLEGARNFMKQSKRKVNNEKALLDQLEQVKGFLRDLKRELKEMNS